MSQPINICIFLFAQIMSRPFLIGGLLVLPLFAQVDLSLDHPPRYRPLVHFDYVNVNAPKGGKIRLSQIGTYDSFYSFLLKGTPAARVDLVFDTLMVRSLDEPSSQYGLIAQSLEVDPNNNFVIFHLNPKARFSDGSEVNAFDVAFSFQTIARGDNPAYRRYYKDVKEAIVLDKHTIRFDFANNQNRELPLILGDLIVLSKQHYQEMNPKKPPLGSGPYTIERFELGRSITYKRNKDYWALHHPTRIGLFNFDEIVVEYYKDDGVALEAFKAGKYDYRQEVSAKSWARGYMGKSLEAGDIVLEKIPHSLPTGMQGFVFNLRKPIFQDILVRKALSYAFDFEWSNRALFFGEYKRTTSYFENSPFASTGIPQGQERDILLHYQSQLPKELFSQAFEIPKTLGDGNNRNNLKKAQALLRQAGMYTKNGKLFCKDGRPFVFELLLVAPAMERVAIPFAKNLEILGIEMKIRLVDVSQYLNRLRLFDYDMIVANIPQSLSPGNEQSFFWGSKAAKENGSYNYAGIQNPIIDALIEAIIQAHSYDGLLYATRALDRVLLWNYYMIPQFYAQNFRVAYWDFLEHPNTTPLYDIGFDSWWLNPQKLQRLKQQYPQLKR